MEHIKRYRLWLIGCVAVLLLLFYAASPPKDFPRDTLFVVEQGASVQEIAEELARARIVAHPTVLRLILQITGVSGRVQAGTYAFMSPQNVFVIAYRLSRGAYDTEPVRLTLPEGVTAREIADTVAATFPTVATSSVTSLVEGKEGYLFPDTYYLSPDASAEMIVEAMLENFETKARPLLQSADVSRELTSHEVVTMASLIEKEGRSTEVRKMIAGILYNRLARGMPLQTDAVFGYILNRKTYSPSFADLKIDSLYNTYLYKGLPPGPICNPGLDSIRAALSPTRTDYLYYLTDKEGVMHYATTYAEHLVNQNTYLK